MLRKQISLLCVLALLCALLCGCGSSGSDETNRVNILTISGPTGMGMAQMMKKSADGLTDAEYSFRVTANPSDILTAIVSGEADIAACPINLAATIWNKTGGQVQLLGVNTLGVLYIVTNGVEIGSFADLDGKTVLASGEGAIPDAAMQYLCAYFGIHVDLQFVDTFANCAAMLASGEVGIALLAEPSVSSALMKNPDLKVALDIGKIWSIMEKKDGTHFEQMVQGCVIVRKEFAEAHPDLVSSFLKDYRNSVDYVTALENLKTAAQYCELYGILPKAAIAEKAIPNSNIVLITGRNMKDCVSEALNELYDFAPSTVGGKVPEGAFYYGAET